MDNSANLSGGQLPPVQHEGSSQASNGAGQPTPPVPPAVAMTPVQMVQAVFTDSTLTPQQVTQRFIQLKSDYLASQGVVTDGQA